MIDQSGVGLQKPQRTDFLYTRSGTVGPLPYQPVHVIEPPSTRRQFFRKAQEFLNTDHVFAKSPSGDPKRQGSRAGFLPFSNFKLLLWFAPAWSDRNQSVFPRASCATLPAQRRVEARRNGMKSFPCCELQKFKNPDTGSVRISDLDFESRQKRKGKGVGGRSGDAAQRCSRLFAGPASERMAVKIIDHLGDEVMKVFRV